MSEPLIAANAPERRWPSAAGRPPGPLARHIRRLNDELDNLRFHLPYLRALVESLRSRRGGPPNPNRL